MFRKYTLKKPARRHARIGAFYAGLLPVIMGVLLLVGSMGQSITYDKAIYLPIAIAFIFGTPIVAWLSQDAIMRKEKLDFFSLFEVAIIWATIIQLVFGTLYLVFYTLKTETVFEFTNLLSVCITAHIILWGLITLPLSLICSIIFKLSALRPIYG